jgi:hypothetical protein
VPVCWTSALAQVSLQASLSACGEVLPCCSEQSLLVKHVCLEPNRGIKQ